MAMGAMRAKMSLNMLQPEVRASVGLRRLPSRQAEHSAHLPEKENINDILLTDMHLSPDDTQKVDLITCDASKCVPFLDYEVVNLAVSLPWKQNQRRHAEAACRMPSRYSPGSFKTGRRRFEVPVLKWFRGRCVAH